MSAFNLRAVAIFILLLVSLMAESSSDTNQIEILPLSEFNNNLKVSLHMPCEESNMFATKCMCHIKCTDRSCKNAVELCQKYRNSKGCKYVLKRNVGKFGIATLKREPLPEEFRRFNTDEYPKSYEKLRKSSWKDYEQNFNTTMVKLLHLLEKTSNGSRIMKQLTSGQSLPTSGASQSFCPQISNDGTVKSELKKWPEVFLNHSISLFALNYRTPKTLINSLKTWKDSGLLDMVSEKKIFLNDALPEEIAMSRQHGFDILQPKNMPAAKKSKADVITIGTAFYEALMMSKSEFILFLENDFKMDSALSREHIQAELLGAAGLLMKGAEVIRLQSRKYQGCGTFKTCDHHGIHLKDGNPMERRRNWFAFYCKNHLDSNGYVSDCLDEPSYRCFTSWDSNWTLNAVLVRRSTMLSKKYSTPGEPPLTIAEVGRRSSQENDAFERAMSWELRWMNWKVPICISYNGLFIHEEIETST